MAETQKLEQRDETPGIEEYCALRTSCGLAPRSIEAAAKGLPNSLYSTTVRSGREIVGMGRVVGDGGCNYEVVDIAVHPDFQRRGIGKMIMTQIMAFIRRAAPESAYVCLIADHHSPALYSQFGFEFTSPNSVGMAQTVNASKLPE